LKAKVDKVTRDIIMHNLEAVCWHMSETLISTSYSPIFYDAMDFSTALFDKDENLVAQTIGCPVHLAAMPFSVKETRKEFRHDMEDGDVFLLNDPYRGGSHIGDYTFVTPVFRNAELVGYSCTRAHVVDSGQAAPAFFAHATEIVQEGLRIPPVRIYTKSGPVKDVIKLVLSHTRLPTYLAGDMRAAVAANKIGRERLLKLYEKYGDETVRFVMEQALDYAEKLVRAGIKEIPEGTYSAEDYIDSDGISPDPVKLKVTIKVKNDGMRVDWTGTDPPARGPVNRPKHATIGDTLYGLKPILDPSGPTNAGSFRPIDVFVPEGCLLSAKWPSPVDRGNNETSARITDTMWRALAPVVPKKVIGITYGYAGGISAGGMDPRSGIPYAFWEGPPGGWGGRHNKDGISANWHLHGNVRDTPIEVMEVLYPVRITRSELMEDSGGPGKFRGGLGLVREYKFLGHEPVVSIGGERSRTGPPGFFGGKPGAPFRGSIISPAGGEEVVSGYTEDGKLDINFKTFWKVEAGSTVRLENAGGGGYGDPMERDPEMVLSDVLDGYISVDAARDVYGVVFKDGDRRNLGVDEAKTEELKGEKRKSEKQIS
jgi:5-oxoprolinase (ATP-hydrolysing)/N-methylhydantoinase B